MGTVVLVGGSVVDWETGRLEMCESESRKSVDISEVRVATMLPESVVEAITSGMAVAMEELSLLTRSSVLPRKPSVC